MTLKNRLRVSRFRKKKALSGGAKMKKAGRHAIMLGVDPSVWQTLKTAADLEMRAVSNFVTRHALIAAEKLLAAQPVKAVDHV